MSIRTERVAKLLQRELAGILSTEYSDQLKPMVTVTGVQVTNDLSIATCYVSVLGDDPAQKNATFGHLSELTTQVRTRLASRIRHQLKSVPELRFKLDETLTEAARLEELFGKIRSERKGNDVA
jgi:ribosome-binding factor A